MNILYTFPNCEKCSCVKKILQSKGINYQEVNAGLGSGRKEFQKLYEKYKKNIVREQGQVVLPIFLFNSKIIQGLEKISESIN